MNKVSSWEAEEEKHDIREITFKTRTFFLPGHVLKPGDIVLIQDTRGNVTKGVFYGYSGGFLAFTESCDNIKPSVFISSKRIANIMILNRCE